MKVESSKKNFFYNIIYQILILIIPFIVTPYVSRVLGAEGVGEYSYTYSIVSYFMMFAMLGFNNYGNRSIARVRDDREKLSRTFKEIYMFQAAMCVIAVALYAIYLLIFGKEYLVVGIAQTAYVVSCFFDINWFFFGIERFKLTVIRSVVIKIVALFAVFVFVNSPDDVWVYAVIMSLSTLFSQVALWPFLVKYINKGANARLADMKKHVKPCLVLFLPVVAVSIYRIIDKTMLGSMAGLTEVGYYESAEKTVSIPCAFISALGTVMLPRMSNIYSKTNSGEQEGKKVIERSMSAMMFLSFIMMFGLICISENFSVLFFGSDFADSAPVMSLLSITILLLSWGNVIRTQFLIPKGMDRDYTISAFLGAGVNVIFNLIFIPSFGAMGACIGTIMAEAMVTVYQTYVVRKSLPILTYMRNIFPFFVTSLLVFGVIYVFNAIEMNPCLRIVLQIMVAVIFYGCLNYRYVYENILKSIVSSIRGIRRGRIAI